MTVALNESRANVVWLAWQRHRRTEELCRALCIECHVFAGGGVSRYLRATWWTIAVLRRRRPKVLIVQNPSMVLALVAGTVCPLFNCRLVVDRHTYFFRSTHSTGALLNKIAFLLSDITVRAADLTIVTNEALAREVRQSGGRPFVLPDRIPTPPSTDLERSGRAWVDAVEFQAQVPHRVLFVSSFSHDEPIDEVVSAARLLGDGYEIRITGRPSGRFCDKQYLARLPGNVLLTGYLSEELYWGELSGADLVVVLTKLDNCLTCGAYEAVALGRAMVLSDTSAIREYFDRGAIYATASAPSIAEAIRKGIDKKQVLAERVLDLRRQLNGGWDMMFEELCMRIKQLEKVPKAGGGPN